MTQTLTCKYAMIQKETDANAEMKDVPEHKYEYMETYV